MMTYDVFTTLPVKHYPSLYTNSPKEEKFFSYKLISIVAAIQEITLPGDWAEFGVYKGATARVLEAMMINKRKLYLFDSFEGLPEDWAGGKWKKGAFQLSHDEVPTFDSEKSVIVKGWFDATIPKFILDHQGHLAFLHIDCDLYSSTKAVLMGLNHKIVPGTILLFDELFMPHALGVADDECRALFDWTREKKRTIKILWKTAWMQCAVRITA